MTMRQRLGLSLASGLSALLILSACGPTSQHADLNYVAWSESSVRQSTIAKARESQINICFQGSVSSADFERAKVWARRAVLTWLRVAKLIDHRVTNQVAYTCENRHLTINLRTGSGTSFASPGVTTIYTTRPYGTWTHEFGHALAALGDTYAGGAGSCQSGQPQSLMCWGAYGPRANPDQWSTLWADDIAGLQHNYRRVFTDQLVAPDWAGSVNVESPLDLENPWPADEVLMSESIDSLVQIDDALGASAIDYDPNTRSIDL